MKPCVNCQKNEAEYCSGCIDDAEQHRVESDTKSLLLAFCVSCETIIGQKNVEEHVGHHINLRRVRT